MNETCYRYIIESVFEEVSLKRVENNTPSPKYPNLEIKYIAKDSCWTKKERIVLDANQFVIRGGLHSGRHRLQQESDLRLFGHEPTTVKMVSIIEGIRSSYFMIPCRLTRERSMKKETTIARFNVAASQYLV